MPEGPRILTLDIETSPTLAYVWGLWNQNISLSQIIEPTRMLSFAAKWYGERKVLFFSEFHQSREEMVQGAYDLLDEADGLVTFNGDNFDIPHLQREFQMAGLGRPAPFKSIDLYKVTKKHQRYISHKLAHITEQLGLTGKLKHQGFDLWRDCLAGDEKAWRIMRRYNMQDVVTTEELYVELLPWIDNHPTFALFVDDDAPMCPKCGSTKLQRRGLAAAASRVYRRYQCQDCNSWSKGGKSVKGVDIR